MTEVDFYLLPETDADSRFTVACRLLEKAYRQGLNAHVCCANQADLEQLDHQLWTFRPGSFVPHDMAENNTGSVPISLGIDHKPAPHISLLMNLRDTVPDYHSQFVRVLELVPPHPVAKQQARVRYSFYNDLGYVLRHHQL